jgi:hypothetical protein
MSKEIVAGVAGGLVGAGLARLTAEKPKEITASKRVIERQTLAPLAETPLVRPTRFKFAVILIHGDGDPQIELDVRRDATSINIRGNEQAIEVLANETISITAINTDTSNSRNTPTIEIASLL